MPRDEESDRDGEKDHVCFSLFRNQARQRHAIALQPDICQPFVIWPQFVICCLWFCNTIRICNLWFCELYCNQNSLLTFRYKRIRMYMVLIMTRFRGALILLFWYSSFKQKTIKRYLSYSYQYWKVQSTRKFHAAHQKSYMGHSVLVSLS